MMEAAGSEEQARMLRKNSTASASSSNSKVDSFGSTSGILEARLYRRSGDIWLSGQLNSGEGELT